MSNRAAVLLAKAAYDMRVDGYEGIAALVELGATADLLIANHVRHERAAGESWAAIGAQLGVSRQAAHKRFSPLSM